MITRKSWQRCLGAAAVWCVALVVFADSKVAVQEAQSAILRRDRTRALNILREARIRAVKPAEREQLRAEEKRLSEIFLSDKGQRTYELAQALVYESPAEALRKLTEAESLEGENRLIRLAKVRAQLAQKNCKDAQTLLGPGLDEEEISEDQQQLELAAVLCAEDISGLRGWLAKKNLPKGVWVRYAEARLAAMDNAADRAWAILSDAVGSGDDFPLVGYWAWKVAAQTGRPGERAAKRYLNLCRSRLQELRRKYRNFPDICLHTSEVEAYLKNQPTDAAEGSL